MALDTAQGQAITRLTGTLQALGLNEGFSRAEQRYYVLIATAIATGLIPYIDGRDAILQRQIDELRTRLNTLEALARSNEGRITNLEQQIGSLVASIASLASAPREYHQDNPPAAPTTRPTAPRPVAPTTSAPTPEEPVEEFSDFDTRPVVFS